MKFWFLCLLPLIDMVCLRSTRNLVEHEDCAVEYTQFTYSTAGNTDWTTFRYIWLYAKESPAQLHSIAFKREYSPFLIL